MWMLALGGVFLATAQACVLCHLPDRDLAGRLAKLCSRVEARWKDCRASWSFPAFALDETSMNNVIEKTHRVLRVMEIKGSLSSLPLYRHWLQNTKLPAYSREALCAPACRGSTVVYNCSTCQELDVCCWPRKRCLPGSTPPPGLPWLRKSRSLGSQGSAPRSPGGCLPAGCSEPHGGVSRGRGPVTWKKKGRVKVSTASQPPVLKTMNPQLPLPSKGISQPLSSTPRGSVFQTRKPRRPLDPSVRGPPGTQAPHWKSPPSSPQLIRQEQPAAGSRKLSTEGKNPLLATPPTPPPACSRKAGAACPRSSSWPSCD
ncbi:sperm-egg fusion protein TMEM95 isoform X1 [Mustela lutreola]|uniref:sperm-egg fusion protein TMEM95 isoform X1 n=2 Tax=Mustela lutreola TaxID=9666 RepID=UPI002797817A|nr:sperm-egg fusion protein TMEM95 isoform X1 [Mustela lutreola]